MGAEGTYLEGILRSRRERLAADMEGAGTMVLREKAMGMSRVRSLYGALAKGGGTKVIAEIKRASPSKGDLAPGLDPAQLARLYEASGARALSVLTEPDFFRGKPEDLAAARGAVQIPVLRKDFLLAPAHIYQSRAMGADAVLLIVAVLGQETARMLEICRENGLEALVEVHTAVEMEAALEAGAKMIGINNRDLHTFQVSLEVTERLADLVPKDAGVILVSESGIRTRADVQRVCAAGAVAVLVGESLVTAPDPGAALQALLGG